MPVSGKGTDKIYPVLQGFHVRTSAKERNNLSCHEGQKPYSTLQLHFLRVESATAVHKTQV